MNTTIEQSIKEDIKQMLKECTEGQQEMFKRMYAKKGNIELSIDEVVDNMDSAKLDHAYTQTERSYTKNKEINNG